MNLAQAKAARAARAPSAPITPMDVATAIAVVVVATKATATWTRDASISVIGSTPAATRNYLSDMWLVASESWNAQR